MAGGPPVSAIVPVLLVPTPTMYSLTFTTTLTTRSRAIVPVAAAMSMTALVLVLSVSSIVAVALGPAAAAAAVDVRTLRLPDRLVVLTAVVPVAAVLVAPVDRVVDHAALLLLGAVVMGGPLVLLHLVAPAAVGFGDVKLAAALGVALGSIDPRLGFVALAVASGATLLAAASLRRSTLPFGPGLVLGAAVSSVVDAQWATVTTPVLGSL